MSAPSPLAGHYALLQPLSATLHLALDQRTGAQVFAREIPLPPELEEDARRDLTGRIVAEAEVAGRLRHPSINRVLDAFVDGDRPWIITLPISGRPLDEMVAGFGPLTPVQVAGLGVELVGALRAAHALGILHGDIGPSRIWLTPDGHAVLTGFGGGARARSGEAASVGTPGFTAPERLDGSRPAPAADLWSLAASLYFAAEGVPAFGGDGPLAVLSAVVAGTPRPPERSAALGPVLAGQLAKDPADRPADLRDALERIAEAGPGDDTAVRVKPLGLLAGALGLAVAAASIAVIATVGLTEPKKPPAAPVAAPAAAPDEPGKWAEMPRACSQLTDTQVTELVPNGSKQLGDTYGGADPKATCVLHASDADLDVRIEFVLMTPGPIGNGPETAQEFVTGERADAEESAKYGAGGGDSQSPVREVPGLGDKAIAYDAVRLGDHTSVTVFSVSNLAVVVTTRNDLLKKDAPGIEAKVKAANEKASSLVAASLNRQG
ncbi:serine/threonine-protein kinase [Actinocorallia longicatena]|uniref:non-specific serine/threonine protein kinase n=1 Tax=Actinocorallia longicatena TaxID=111803 RepID=A0ABP6QFY3_9ACTN